MIFYLFFNFIILCFLLYYIICCFYLNIIYIYIIMYIVYLYRILYTTVSRQGTPYQSMGQFFVIAQESFPRIRRFLDFYCAVLAQVEEERRGNGSKDSKVFERERREMTLTDSADSKITKHCRRRNKVSMSNLSGCKSCQVSRSLLHWPLWKRLKD
jgi:hypothetical protein